MQFSFVGRLFFGPPIWLDTTDTVFQFVRWMVAWFIGIPILDYSLPLIIEPNPGHLVYIKG